MQNDYITAIVCQREFPVFCCLRKMVHFLLLASSTVEYTKTFSEDFLVGELSFLCISFEKTEK